MTQSELERPLNATVFIQIVEVNPAEPDCTSPAGHVTFSGDNHQTNFSNLQLWPGPAFLKPSALGRHLENTARSLIESATLCDRSASAAAAAWQKAGWIFAACGDLSTAIRCYTTALRIYRTPSTFSDARVLDMCLGVSQARQMDSFLQSSAESSAGQKLSDAYASHLDSLMRIQIHNGPLVAPTVVYGVVTGSKWYQTRAQAVAETWMSDQAARRSYLYSDTAGRVRVCPAQDRRSCSLREVVALSSSDSLLRQVATRDDFFSSVAKFVLGLVDLYRRHESASWYFLVGCDTYVIPRNLEASLSGSERFPRLPPSSTRKGSNRLPLFVASTIYIVAEGVMPGVVLMNGGKCACTPMGAR